MEEVEVQVLGPPRIVAGGDTHPVRSVQMQRVLASLVVADGAPVDDAALSERLWGDHPPASRRSGLQVVVNRLRGLLQPDGDGATARAMVRRVGSGYLLDPGLVRSDVGRVGELVGAAERSLPGRPDRARGHLAEALGSWRGEPWPELVDDAWLAPERARLQELRHRTEELLVDATLLSGRPGEAVTAARAAVEREPFRERRWVQLVLALAGDGRQREALTACEEARRLLAEELGLAPGPELADVQRRVLDGERVVPPAGRVATGPGAGVASVPVPAVELVGRDRELEAVRSALGSGRLVTLTGLGGVGKSTLAHQVAAEADDHFPDGTALVAVDGSPTDRPWIDDLARALGLAEPDGDVVAATATFLRERRLLLLLDGCEHEPERASELAVAALGAGPGVRVLATSRVPLMLPSEVVVPIEPLTVPELDDPAPAERPSVRLLLDRLGPGRVDLDLAVDRRAVVALVRSVDGLPLGIELLAARCRALTVPALAAAVASDLGIVAGHGRGRPDRHRSLVDCIDDSLALVDDEATRVLAELAALPAPVSPELLGLTEDPGLLDVVEQLVAASLVSAGPPTGHIRMLDTIRARVRRDPDDAAIGRVATRCRAFVERRRTWLRTGPQDRAVRELEDQYDNVLAVVEALESAGRGAEASAIAAALDRFWFLVPRGAEPRRVLGGLAERAEADGRRRDAARLRLALAEATKSEDSGLPAHHDHLVASAEVLEAEGEYDHAADARCMLVIATGWVGRVDEMREHAAAARALVAGHLTGHPEADWFEAVDAYGEAMTTGFAGDLAGALERLLDARERVAEVGDLALAGRMSLYAALVADMLGDRMTHRRELRRAAELTDLGLPTGADHKVRVSLAEAAVKDGSPEAEVLLHQAVESAERRNDRLAVARCLRELGALSVGVDDERAAMWLRAGLTELADLDATAFHLALLRAGPLLERRGRADIADELRRSVASDGSPRAGAEPWDLRELEELLAGTQVTAGEARVDVGDLLRLALRGLSDTSRGEPRSRSVGV